MRNLKVHFKLPEGTVRAVDGVNLKIHPGECFVLIGETGCGKTILGRSLIRLLPPGAKVQGEILYQGADIIGFSPKKMEKIRGKEIAIILQNPLISLNPLLQVGKQIAEAIKLRWKLPGETALHKARGLLEKVGLQAQAAAFYPHQLSGGMRQRALLSVGLACEPRLLIADEPTKGLDNLTRVKLINVLRTCVKEAGRALFLVTHDLVAAKELADTIAVMYAGQIVETGPAAAVINTPKHPYTQSLIAAHPSGQMKPIPGLSPSLLQIPSGCRFHPRCQKSLKKCLTEEQHLDEEVPGHWVRCNQCS